MLRECLCLTRREFEGRRVAVVAGGGSRKAVTGKESFRVSKTAWYHISSRSIHETEERSSHKGEILTSVSSQER